jgi:hypothetical protein
MSDKKEAQERKAAEERLAEAQEKLAAAQEEAAEANQGLVAMVTRDVPRVLVEVKEGHNVSDVTTQEMKYGGDTLELDGPTAIALMQAGQVIIKGEV